MLPHKKSTLTRFPNACKHPIQGAVTKDGTAAPAAPLKIRSPVLP